MVSNEIVGGASSVIDHSGNLLRDAGLIGQAQLQVAQDARSEVGCTVGEYLVQAGLIDDDEITEFYHQTLKVPRLTQDRLQHIPHRAIAMIPQDLAAEFRVIPVSLDTDNTLTLAMSDPSNHHALDEIAFFTNCYIVRAVATQRQIAWCLAEYYGYVTALGDEVTRSPRKKTASKMPARFGSSAGTTRQSSDSGMFETGSKAIGTSDGIPEAVVDSVTQKYEQSRQIIRNGSVEISPEIYISDALSTADSGTLPPIAVVETKRNRTQHELSEPSAFGKSTLEAMDTLAFTESREQVIDCLLNAIGSHNRAIFFVVKRGEVCPWKSRGIHLSVTAQTLMVGDFSTLATVVRSQSPYYGAPNDEPTCAFLSVLLGDLPDYICVIPVVAGGRVIGVFYTDGPGADKRCEQMLAVTKAAGKALERIVRANRGRLAR